MSHGQRLHDVESDGTANFYYRLNAELSHRCCLILSAAGDPAVDSEHLELTWFANS